MKKRSLFLAVAAGLLVLGVGAPKSQAGYLDSLLGTTVGYGGLDFTFDTWKPTGGAPDAADVAVTFETVGGYVGFTLNGSFGAGANSTSDGYLVYNVSGTQITSALLMGNPAPQSGKYDRSGVGDRYHPRGTEYFGTQHRKPLYPEQPARTFERLRDLRPADHHHGREGHRGQRRVHRRVHVCRPSVVRRIPIRIRARTDFSRPSRNRPERPAHVASVFQADLGRLMKRDH